MKSPIFRSLAGGLLAFSLVLCATLIQSGCSAKSSPSSPAATPTPALSIEGMFVRRSNTSGTLTYVASAWLQLGGQPVANAGVTLSSTGAAVSLPIPYSAPVTNGSNYYSLYTTTAAFTYTAGQTYVLSATASGQTASVSLMAPGGSITAFRDSNGAVTEFTDSVAGNTVQVSVQCAAPSTLTYNANPSASNSIGIPDNGSANVYAAPGTLYQVTLNAQNNLTPPASFQMGMDDQYSTPATVLDNLFWFPYIHYSHDPNLGDGYNYQVGLNVQGTAPTTAAVTVSEASNTLALPYSSITTSSGVSYALYSSSSSSIPYSPGSTYVVSATGAAGTASVTFPAAPGPVVAGQDTTTQAITQLSWTNAGTLDQIVSMNEVSPSAVTTSYDLAYSPVNFLLATFYSGVSSGTIYQATTDLISTTTSSPTNGVLDSGAPVEIRETYTQTVTFN